MLDDTRDPTPLLKEIRDDKTATIIIHANASMSHTILLKVGVGRVGAGGHGAPFPPASPLLPAELGLGSILALGILLGLGCRSPGLGLQTLTNLCASVSMDGT